MLDASYHLSRPGRSTFVEKTKDIRTIPQTGLSDENSELEPPDPIPNSEVKRLSADGSVGVPM